MFEKIKLLLGTIIFMLFFLKEKSAYEEYMDE